MLKVLVLSALIIAGILTSQWIDLTAYRGIIQFATLSTLSYIMIEVGLEFSIDKSKLSSYGKDYLVAMTAAAFPWILCTLWIWAFFDVTLSQATIIGRFAAPTSAGVLFTLLAAAGLAATWVFKKARILAIFDDLDTILLIIPLQMLHIGLKWHAVGLLVAIALLLFCAYRYLHQLAWPTQRLWLIAYAIVITGLCEWLGKTLFINLEVLLPAFVLGCILRSPHLPHPTASIRGEQHPFMEPSAHWEQRLDMGIKMLYMFLVGCSLPQMPLHQLMGLPLLGHILALTLLSNLGKLYPMFCYGKEASLRERVALSIAMWPRGEVGVGVLLISINYALPENALQVAALSLTLNLMLTGVFIAMVMKLLRRPTSHF